MAVNIGEVPIPDLEPENGPELAYGTLVHDLGSLRHLDSWAPIFASFRVEQIPRGEFVPAEIREQWVGVDVPVRFTALIEAGGIEFGDDDAVLSLLASGKIDAAKWFVEHRQAGTPGWMFHLSEGILTDSRETGQEPMTSIEYYGLSLEQEARERLENPN